MLKESRTTRSVGPDRGVSLGPTLLATYDNRCVARCSEQYRQKSDGDTVATEAFAPTLERLRSSPAQTRWQIGAPLHEPHNHLVAGHPAKGGPLPARRDQIVRLPL